MQGLKLPIQTVRTWLRPFVASDAPAVYAYASDPETTCFMAWERHKSTDATNDFIQRSQISLDNGTAFHLAIELKANGRMIGSAGFDVDQDTASIGYILHKDFWGQGLAGEVSRALIQQIQQLSEIKRITSCCHVDNGASRRVLEKLGLQLCDEAGAPQCFPNLDADRNHAYLFEMLL